MANKKISALTDLGATPAVGDILPITDISDTTGSLNGTTKKVTVADLVAAAPQGDLLASNNLNDLGSNASARTNLGLGTAATLNVGTADTNVVQLSNVGGTVKLPAVDGSQLINLPSSSTFYDIVTETTTARTLSDSDNGKVIVCTNGATTNITIPNTLSAGFSCTLVQNSASNVIAGAGVGVTLNAIDNKFATQGQYASMQIIPVASNSYVLTGEIAAPPYSNNYSLDFDGSNDYVVGSASSLTVGTVSCWFYNDIVISAATATGQVVFSQGGSDFGIVLGNQTSLTNEIISIQYGSGAFGYTSPTDSISVGWHHVMIAWVSSSSTNPGSAGYDFWLDGVKVGNSSVSPPSAPDTLSTSFYIGARGGTYRFFNGKIDEFALWTGDVSGDIGNIYDPANPAAVDLSDSAVVGTSPNVWWRCGDNDGGSPTTITDQGSAGFDGTINGATPVLDTP